MSSSSSSTPPLLQVQHVGAWGTHPGPAFGAGLRGKVRLVCQHVADLIEVQAHLQFPRPLLIKSKSFLGDWLTRHDESSRDRLPETKYGPANVRSAWLCCRLCSVWKRCEPSVCHCIFMIILIVLLGLVFSFYCKIKDEILTQSSEVKIFLFIVGSFLLENRETGSWVTAEKAPKPKDFCR